MKQLTLRVDDRLTQFLKQAAAARGESVNAYAQAVLAAAVDPDLAGDETTQMRERLRRAGLLAVVPDSSHVAPDPSALAGARKRAGRGKSLASFVVEDRS
jgi:plasmid stability protein